MKTLVRTGLVALLLGTTGYAAFAGAVSGTMGRELPPIEWEQRMAPACLPYERLISFVEPIPEECRGWFPTE
jgi:hypothetical protein